ncbi:2OG-Fe(II) oxygenase [Thalassotalea maritima]|uniref:2OG-Fe(II) oxygenase n=1 Tax=Thalassotalea maritima TaxID=3242416 RepID=UPI003528B091
MAALHTLNHAKNGNNHWQALFAKIADDIWQHGYSIQPSALPEDIAESLYCYQQNLHVHKYLDAGIGRNRDYLKNEFVRTDAICWITGESDAGKLWLDWAAELQSYLNRRLFLGLFSFESHFAHYAPGDYYKRHYDAFRGETNRVLSMVTYLNPHWQASDKGELVLYRDDDDKQGIKVIPLYGTIVVFLSEEFPHEVLPANRDRYSIAGWYRVNTSIDNKLDPPR